MAGEGWRSPKRRSDRIADIMSADAALGTRSGPSFLAGERIGDGFEHRRRPHTWNCGPRAECFDRPSFEFLAPILSMVHDSRGMNFKSPLTNLKSKRRPKAHHPSLSTLGDFSSIGPNYCYSGSSKADEGRWRRPNLTLAPAPQSSPVANKRCRHRQKSNQADYALGRARTSSLHSNHTAILALVVSSLVHKQLFPYRLCILSSIPTHRTLLGRSAPG